VLIGKLSPVPLISLPNLAALSTVTQGAAEGASPHQQRLLLFPAPLVDRSQAQVPQPFNPEAQPGTEQAHRPAAQSLNPAAPQALAAQVTVKRL